MNGEQVCQGNFIFLKFYFQIHEKEELESNDRTKQNEPKSLMELSLTKFVAETAFKLLTKTSLMKSEEDE